MSNLLLTSSRYHIIMALLNWMVENNLTPYIVVNADYPNIKVPQAYVKYGQIILNISANATTRFELHPAYLTFQASFNTQLQTIRVPLRAIEAMYAKENGEGMNLGFDLPGEGLMDSDDREGGEALSLEETKEDNKAQASGQEKVVTGLKIIK